MIIFLLPAGVNEDTGEGRHHNEIIADRQLDYLILNYWRDIPPDVLKKIVLWSPECAGPIASDTMTECKVAYNMVLRALDGRYPYIQIDAVGIFPHSLKVMRCWNAFLRQERWRLYCGDSDLKIEVNVHHVSPRLDSWGETVRQCIMNVISTMVGLFDPWGRHFPAKQIKKRRRDRYTPNRLKNRVIF